MDTLANIIAFIIIGLFTRKSHLAKIIFIFYILYFLVYQLDVFYSLSYDAWYSINLFIDLIIISLCYTCFMRYTKKLYIAYIGWVIVGYIIPELLSLNDINVSYNESNIMCVIDVLFAIYAGVISNDNDCYNNNSKHNSDYCSDRMRSDKRDKAQK